MLVQRWRERRHTFRPAREVICTSDFEVARLDDDRTARAFVEAHHYSRSFPAARWRFGLYRRGELAGVAVFSVPMQDAVITTCLPGDARDSAELGRFVLLDDVAGNGETWFLARCFEELRRDGLVGVVSFSDPVPRTRADGHRVFVGHVGTIYQAFNGVYLGRARPSTLRLLPDGGVFSNRAQSKIRRHERGWRYAAAILERFGAAPLSASEDAAAWLERWRAQLTRTLRHGGNHKYVWAVDRRARRHLPDGRPYPKQVAEAVVAANTREAA